MTEHELFLARTNALNRCVAELDELRAKVREWEGVCHRERVRGDQLQARAERAEAALARMDARHDAQRDARMTAEAKLADIKALAEAGTTSDRMAWELAYDIRQVLKGTDSQ